MWTDEDTEQFKVENFTIRERVDLITNLFKNLQHFACVEYFWVKDGNEGIGKQMFDRILEETNKDVVNFSERIGQKALLVKAGIQYSQWEKLQNLYKGNKQMKILDKTFIDIFNQDNKVMNESKTLLLYIKSDLQIEEILFHILHKHK